MRYFIWKEPRRLQEKAEQDRARFFSQIQFLKNQPVVPDPSLDNLSESARRIMIKTCVDPPKELTVLYEELGFHPQTGRRAIDELLAGGLVKIHTLPRLGRGGRPRVIEILPEADKILDRIGIQRPALYLKGGWKHSLYGWLVQQWAIQSNHQSQFDQTFGSKNFDILLRPSDGTIKAVEICLSGSAGRTAEQLLHGLKRIGLAELIAVFESKTLLDQSRGAVQKIDVDDLATGRLQLRLIAEFVELQFGGKKPCRTRD